MKLKDLDYWKPLKHPMILDGYLISNEGYIRNKDCDESDCLTADYHSSNGYDFIMLIVKEKYRINNSLFMLFPIDELLGITFIPIPKELKDKPITIKHINGDTRDNHISNLEWIEDIEEWRDCTYPGVKPGMYEVSSWGRVRNKETLYLYCQCLDKDGYPCTSIKNINNKWRLYRIHRLLLYDFTIKANDKYCLSGNHINGIKTCNTVKNLEYITMKDNLKHAWFCGLNNNKNENHYRSKLSNAMVRTICEMIISYKGNSKQIYDILYNKGYNIKISDILNIKSKASYCNISDEYFAKGEYNTQKKFNESTVDIICKLLIKYNGDISKVLNWCNNNNIIGISYNDIYAIKTRKTWKYISSKYNW